MDAAKIVTSLFTLIVIVGAMTLIVKNPQGAVQLMSAGANGVSGVTKGLEGRG